jgi:hypothetical protein
MTLIDSAPPAVADVATAPAASQVVDAPVAAPVRRPSHFNPKLGKLPLPPLREGRAKRVAFDVIAAVVVVGFFLWMSAYYVPAHSGVDQNGYLVGAKQLAATLTMKQAPEAPGHAGQFDPHQFVARMWVGADYNTSEERFYPKYPIGLPLIYAAMLWVGDGLLPLLGAAKCGVWLVYWVNPVAMTLGVAATYLLGRRIAGSFGGALAAIVMATSLTTTQLTNNPNSHATTVCAVAWGMFLLVRWWQQGGLWTGLGAGLLLGYAATIRYTEATLILPILLAVTLRLWGADRPLLHVFAAAAGTLLGAAVVAKTGAALLGLTPVPAAPVLLVGGASAAIEAAGKSVVLNAILCAGAAALLLASVAWGAVCVRAILREEITWARVKFWRDAAVVPLGWLLPVAFLVTYNLIAMGTVTGYDQTNESTGFRWEYFWDNWETMIRHLGTSGIAYMLPLAVIGLLGMFFVNWRLGALLALWIGPCLAIYTFYYWAPDRTPNALEPPTTGYLRFFVTTFPGLLVCGVWLVWLADRMLRQIVPADDRPAGLNALRGWQWAAVIAVVLIAPVATDVAVRVGVRPLNLRPASEYFDLASTTASGVASAFKWDVSLADFRRHELFFPHLAMLAAAGLLGGAACAAVFVRRFAAPALAGGAIALASSASLAINTWPWLESMQWNLLQLQVNVDNATRLMPAGSTVFCADMGTLHHMQLVGDYRLYHGETFNKGFINGLNPANLRTDEEDPHGFDVGRRKALWDRLNALDQAKLDEQGKGIIADTLTMDRRVFVVVPRPLTELQRTDGKPRNTALPDPVKRFLGTTWVAKEAGWWVNNTPFETNERGTVRAKRSLRAQMRGAGMQVFEIVPKT